MQISSVSAQNVSSYTTNKPIHFHTIHDDIDIVVAHQTHYIFFFDFSNICASPIIQTMKSLGCGCIVCEFATNHTLSCTRTNSTYVGIKVEGTCNDTKLQGTEFNNHTRGLWVFGGVNANVSNAVFDQQILPHAGNRWLNNTTTNYPANSNNYGAYLGDNTTVWAAGDPSDFLYNPNNTDAAQLRPIRSTHPNTWFIDNIPASPDPTITCPTCASTGGGGTGTGTVGTGTGGPLQPLTAPNNPDFTASEIAIAEKAINFGAYENVAQWEAEKDLYAKVSEYNGVIVAGSPIDVFRDSIITTEVKDFTLVDKETKAAFDAPVALKLAYNSYRIVADNYLLTLAYLDSLNTSLNPSTGGTLNTTDSLAQVNYEAQVVSIKTQLEATQAQMGQIQSQIEAARDLKIDNALALNALLEEGEVYQYNKKTVTDIYLQTIAKGSTDLTATQWATIALIAQQCPYAGGKAVYEARSIYAFISSEVYDDHTICAAVGINARTANPTKGNTKPSVSPLSSPLGGDRGGLGQGEAIRLYPNPTTGITRLFIPTEYQGSDIVITNAVGQIIQTTAVTSMLQSIDLSAEPTGIYFITLRQAGKIIYQNKLVKVE
jgi:type II secretory pathway pseudopilin PulG